MVDVRVEANFEEFFRRVDRIGKGAIPKAAADSLTAIAFDSQRDLQVEVGTVFDHAVPFTQKAFRVEKASYKKSPIEASVRILPQQAKYYGLQIRGGTRHQGDLAVTGGGVLIPIDAKLTQQGNFPGGPIRWLATLEDKIKGAFVANLGGRAPFLGVWQRKPKGSRKRKSGSPRAPLKLLASFKDAARYEKRFQFYETIQNRFSKDFEQVFLKRFNEEVKRS